jgi:hypothetical protein
MTKKVTDANILQKAKMAISNNTEDCICFAIWRCGIGTDIQKKNLRDWVSSQLGECALYTAWLMRKHYEQYVVMSKKDIKQGRLQWLDWMIAYVKKESP